MNGITPSILRWVEGFLTGRKQKVCVNGSMSKGAEVSSGIPQGSDLPNEMKSNIYVMDRDICIYL